MDSIRVHGESTILPLSVISCISNETCEVFNITETHCKQFTNLTVRFWTRHTTISISSAQRARSISMRKVPWGNQSRRYDLLPILTVDICNNHRMHHLANINQRHSVKGRRYRHHDALIHPGPMKISMSEKATLIQEASFATEMFMGCHVD
jgi:hypothetical protein